MDKIRIGKIVNTHGIKGEVKVLPDTDFQSFRYSNQQPLWIEYNDQFIEVKIKQYRIHKGFDLLLLEGYEDINLVEKWKNSPLYAVKLPVPDLKEGEYHIDDLVGLQVFQTAVLMGEVVGIRTYPQGDYLEVKKSNHAIALIPFRDEFVLSVNLVDKAIEVVDMEGLF
ncbi:MAG: ribosome maturation factor RimM [bacterium]|jgi:16S rRNA processing protein RimM|nr:ribosome maturation factor RimM [bacterium]